MQVESGAPARRIARARRYDVLLLFAGCRTKFAADPEKYLELAPEQRSMHHVAVPVSVTLTRGRATPHPAPSTQHEHPHDRTCTPHPALSTQHREVEYTCPMHPEVVQIGPGSCPICGMALEPRDDHGGPAENPELADMTRRFWVAAALTAPLVLLAMAGMTGGHAAALACRRPMRPWIELALATPVCLWAGWPFFERAWRSVVTRHLNMFTLIGLGVGVAYGYSVVAVAGAGHLSGGVPRRDGARRRLLRGRGGHRHARAARPGARAARAEPDRRRDQARCSVSRRTRPRAAARRRQRRRTCRSATVHAGRPAARAAGRRFRSTASCSKARARSTNRW